MLSWIQIQDNAVRFSKRWGNASSEKSEAQSFLNEFFGVFGIDRLRVANFEYLVYTSHKKGYMDLLWKGRILIEMKSKGESLEKAYEQARGYAFNIKSDEDLPKFIMVSDFENIRLYNLLTGQIFNFKTKNLSNHVKKFAVLTEYAIQYNFVVDKELNIKAANKMAKLHDLLKSFGYQGHNLEVYLVRLLFLLFADDSGIFEKDIFRIYITKSKEDGSDLSSRLFRLFNVLDMPLDEREKKLLLGDELKRFEYINGELFKEILPPADFNQDMRNLLIECCEFDWSTISPAIFGSLFQGVMDKEKRRYLGAHYTSEENILKSIKPLFLDDLYQEFESVKMFPNKLKDFHNKISNLKFLDPACGCGNFLIIAYRELRLLELEILKMKYDDIHRDLWISDEINVNVNQFYGIEVEEFASQIAQVAMWLMDHQMNRLIADEFGVPFKRLPLKDSAKIVFGNALRVNWLEVIDARELDYIIGNPPFKGTKYQSEVQKEDMAIVFKDFKNYKSLDYVAAWYYKAAKMIQDTKIQVALVSTNSITQGEQVSYLWKPLLEEIKMEINFAYRTFKWTNEASGKAAVHCVIIGFADLKVIRKKYIYDSDLIIEAKNINGYLLNEKNIFVVPRTKPLSNVSQIRAGNKPVDGNFLKIESEDYLRFIEKEPKSKKYIKRLIGGNEFLYNEERWVLWLVDASPSDIKSMPLVYERVKKVREARLNMKDLGAQKLAETPTTFRDTMNPNYYIVIPIVTSESREYVPIGFYNGDTIPTNQVQIIPDASLYEFGILSSSVHMAWMRGVCGRHEMRYRYTAKVVYNTFPWPNTNQSIKVKIENTANEILKEREKLEGENLANLYDKHLMPATLRKAHTKLDNLVKELYGFDLNVTETDILSELLKLYSKMTRKY